MNPDGTCCYTEEESRLIDWREIENTDNVEWISLLSPKGPCIVPPCSHDNHECPAKKFSKN